VIFAHDILRKRKSFKKFLQNVYIKKIKNEIFFWDWFFIFTLRSSMVIYEANFSYNKFRAKQKELREIIIFQQKQLIHCFWRSKNLFLFAHDNIYNKRKQFQDFFIAIKILLVSVSSFEEENNGLNHFILCLFLFYMD
jgi:hypothetical protein